MQMSWKEQTPATQELQKHSRWSWLTEYGKDADITRALDTRAFYICPRINPDGAVVRPRTMC